MNSLSSRHPNRDSRDVADGRVRIPADVDRPDRILAGLTARQVALLAVPLLVVWAGYLAVRAWVPLPVFAAFVAPLAVGVVTIALGHRDGISLDRWLLAGLAHRRSPQHLVPAPDGVHPAPAWAGADPLSPSPLRLPARGIDDGGVIDLGADGSAILCRVAPVNFALRTPAEQQALISGFGRYLNSLSTSVQVLARSTPIDLTATVDALWTSAAGLPHPTLETAAREHARYLHELATTRDLLTREVLLVIRDPGVDEAAADRLRRLGADATATLAGGGLSLSVLSAAESVAVLAHAMNPWSGPRPVGMTAPDAIVSASLGAPW